MIIKRVNLCEQTQNPPSLREDKKTGTPRVIIKMKKTVKLQLCQQVSEDSLLEGEINQFNDANYFNPHHRFFGGQDQHRQLFFNSNKIQPIRTKLKQNFTNEMPQETHPETRSDLSRNLFLQFLKKEPIQVGQASALGYPESNYSERQRKYSCSSNRMAAFDCPAPLLTKGKTAQNQSESRRELARWDQKCKSNNSCCVVNPYTQKEYFHQRVTQSSNHQRLKKFRSLDYSIIKPNQIKAAPLSNRSVEKSTMSKRRTERKQFPELIAALKRKEELRTAERPRMRWEEMRVMMHTSYVNRRKVAEPEQKNELQPWEVEGGQSHFADII